MLVFILALWWTGLSDSVGIQSSTTTCKGALVPCPLAPWIPFASGFGSVPVRHLFGFLKVNNCLLQVGASFCDSTPFWLAFKGSQKDAHQFDGPPKKRHAQVGPSVFDRLWA